MRRERLESREHLKRSGRSSTTPSPEKVKRVVIYCPVYYLNSSSSFLSTQNILKPWYSPLSGWIFLSIFNSLCNLFTFRMLFIEMTSLLVYAIWNNSDYSDLRKDADVLRSCWTLFAKGNIVHFSPLILVFRRHKEAENHEHGVLLCSLHFWNKKSKTINNSTHKVQI